MHQHSTTTKKSVYFPKRKGQKSMYQYLVALPRPRGKTSLLLAK